MKEIKKFFIEIIQIPKGVAPEEIRRLWLGAILPLASEEDINNAGVTFQLGEDKKNSYIVLTCEAIKTLKDQDKEALADYLEIHKNIFSPVRIFRNEYCKLVEN